MLYKKISKKLFLRIFIALLLFTYKKNNVKLKI